MKYTKSEIDASLTKLREWLHPGDTVYTILRHVSRSGMSRNISVVVPFGNGDFIHPNHAVAVVTGMPLVRGWNDAIKVGGCGSDMGFMLVYDLSYRLFPNGYGCTGERCNSNDHTNGDRDYTPHNGEADAGVPIKHWHSDGGYALKQKWL